MQSIFKKRVPICEHSTDSLDSTTYAESSLSDDPTSCMEINLQYPTSSTTSYATLKSPRKKKLKIYEKDETYGISEANDEDTLYMKSLVPSLKLIKDPQSKSFVKMEIMRLIHEGVFNGPKIPNPNNHFLQNPPPTKF